MKKKAIKMDDLIRLACKSTTCGGSDWVDVDSLIKSLLDNEYTKIIKGAAPDNLLEAISEANNHKGERIKTMAELATAFGVTRKTIHNWMKKYNIELRKKHDRTYLVDDIIEQLLLYIEHEEIYGINYNRTLHKKRIK